MANVFDRDSIVLTTSIVGKLDAEWVRFQSYRRIGQRTTSPFENYSNRKFNAAKNSTFPLHHFCNSFILWNFPRKPFWGNGKSHCTRGNSITKNSVLIKRILNCLQFCWKYKCSFSRWLLKIFYFDNNRTYYTGNDWKYCHNCNYNISSDERKTRRLLCTTAYKQIHAFMYILFYRLCF